jgi:hypothetical protein
MQDPADFCRKRPSDFGANVYRNSTGVSSLGKSEGKELPTELELLVQPVLGVLAESVQVEGR